MGRNQLKAKLITDTYKTHPIKRINRHTRGNTAAEREYLSELQTDSPT